MKLGLKANCDSNHLYFYHSIENAVLNSGNFKWRIQQRFPKFLENVTLRVILKFTEISYQEFALHLTVFPESLEFLVE